MTKLKPPQWLVLLAATALVITFSDIIRHFNSDSLIPSLVSLYDWQPFFWGQDRYGMLFPLLLSPIKAPLANLLAQTWISAFFGLTQFLVIARYTFGSSAPWAAIGTGSAAALLWIAPATYLGDFFAPSIFYPPATTLGVLALILLERKSWLWHGVALLLMVLAHWINSAAGLFLLALVGAKALSGRYLILPALKGAGLITIGLLAGYFIARLSPHRTLGESLFIPRPEWIEAWAALWGNDDRGAASHWRWDLLIFPAVALVWTWPFESQAASPHRRNAFRAAVVLVLAALVYTLPIGITHHAAQNFFAQRYLQPGILLLVLASAGTAIFLLAPRGRRWVEIGVAVAILCAVPFRFGWPGPSRALDAIHAIPSGGDSLAGRATVNDLISAGCTHIVGDYWKVWPYVLLVNQQHASHGDDRAIQGVSIRSTQSWSDSIQGMAEPRPCVVTQDIGSALQELEIYLGTRSARGVVAGSVVVFSLE